MLWLLLLLLLLRFFEKNIYIHILYIVVYSPWQVRSLPFPTLILHGEEDKLIPLAQSEEFMKEMRRPLHTQHSVCGKKIQGPSWWNISFREETWMWTITLLTGKNIHELVIFVISMLADGLSKSQTSGLRLHCLFSPGPAMNAWSSLSHRRRVWAPEIVVFQTRSWPDSDPKIAKDTSSSQFVEAFVACFWLLTSDVFERWVWFQRRRFWYCLDLFGESFMFNSKAQWIFTVPSTHGMIDDQRLTPDPGRMLFKWSLQILHPNVAFFHVLSFSSNLKLPSLKREKHETTTSWMLFGCFSDAFWMRTSHLLCFKTGGPRLYACAPGDGRPPLANCSCFYLV